MIALFEFIKSNYGFSEMSKKDIKSYNNEIDKAMLEFKNGNFYTHEQVVLELQKRYKN